MDNRWYRGQVCEEKDNKYKVAAKLCQASIRMCSHCLFPVVVTSLEQVVITLLQG